MSTGTNHLHHNTTLLLPRMEPPAGPKARCFRSFGAPFRIDRRQLNVVASSSGLAGTKVVGQDQEVIEVNDFIVVCIRLQISPDLVEG